MDAFARGWWIARAFGSNPLLRRSDRIEASVIVIAISVVLLAAPFAAAVGTDVYGSHGRLYAQQARERHPISATVNQFDIVIATPHIAVTVVRATWTVAGRERTEWFRFDHPVNVGDRIGIWVDKDGNRVGPPAPTWQAVTDALGAGTGIWLSMVLAASAAVAATRSVLNRLRHAQWEREITSWADGGRAGRGV
jgi:hypothetical protein